MIRLEARDATPQWVSVLVAVLSLAVALVITAIVLLVSHHSPLATYGAMIGAAFTNSGALSATLVSATPLVLTGACALLAFRARVYNIGGEGQLYVGAISASGVGLLLGDHGPVIAIIAMIAAGMAGGALWALAPGILRAYFDTNEILTTLMLNYVAGLLAYYLIFNSTSYWRDLTTASARVYPQGKFLPTAADWPPLHLWSIVIPFGFVIGIAVSLGLVVLFRATWWGFQIRVQAGSEQAGRYAGMRTRRAVLLVMLASGALAGLAGASQVGDFSHLLDPTGLQQVAYGYTGIVVAALVRFDPAGVVLGAVFLGALNNAGFSLQGATFPQGLVGTIEGIFLFCVMCGEFFLHYRVRRWPPDGAEMRTARAGAGSAVTQRQGTPEVAVSDRVLDADERAMRQ